MLMLRVCVEESYEGPSSGETFVKRRAWLLSSQSTPCGVCHLCLAPIPQPALQSFPSVRFGLDTSALVI